MHYLGCLLNLLNTKMKTPVPYGIFHVFFLVTSILFGFILFKRYPIAKEIFVRRLLLVVSLIVIALEVYKQINFSFRYENGSISFDYQWYAFPFQFCSTPMYIGLLASLFKCKRLHDCLCSYLATYSLFAGLCVMLYPTTVFVDTIGINIQTMICHGSMVTIGIYLLLSEYVKTELITIRKALPVFLVLISMAIIMNEVAYQVCLLETETFNMFFISPHCPPELPVYSMVQQIVSFPWCVLIYILAFTIAGILMLSFASLLKSFFHNPFAGKGRTHRFIQC